MVNRFRLSFATHTTAPPGSVFAHWTTDEEEAAALMIMVRVLVAVLPQVSVATQQLFWLIVVDDEKPRAEI